MILALVVGVVLLERQRNVRIRPLEFNSVPFSRKEELNWILPERMVAATSASQVGVASASLSLPLKLSLSILSKPNWPVRFYLFVGANEDKSQRGE